MRIDELEGSIKVAQEDIQRLEIDVQEWKLIAEWCGARATK
jgi:hypothetical protein